MLILTSMIVLCLVFDERSNFWPLLYLAEEVFLLKLHSQPLMARLHPQTTNLYAPVSIYLSSDDLMSSYTTHDPISIFGPFIPTFIVLVYALLVSNSFIKVWRYIWKVFKGLFGE